MPGPAEGLAFLTSRTLIHALVPLTTSFGVFRAVYMTMTGGPPMPEGEEGHAASSGGEGARQLMEEQNGRGECPFAENATPAPSLLLTGEAHRNTTCSPRQAAPAEDAQHWARPRPPHELLPP